MKIRFNPETQNCEMLVGATWEPLTPTDAPGDYCAFEIPATLPIAYALTTEHDGPAITIHVSEAAATTAALAYVREELAERDDLRGTEHLTAFEAALARDGVEAALEAARDEHSPEVWYTIEEVTLPVAPSRAPSGVPTFEQLTAWCERFDGDPTEGWLLRVLSGEVTIDNFNRAVLAGTAPEGV